MVLGVCRRLLGNQPDVEDAFQATFLVLVRKAASVRPAEKVGNWLHGVAYRAALKARAALSRRRNREQPLTKAEHTADLNGSQDELAAVLDEELAKLPDKYRLPVVLCDLEGRSRNEVARQLGWPEGTVASRTAEGRARLARLLSKRGLPVSAGILTVWLRQNAAVSAASDSSNHATMVSRIIFAGPGNCSTRATALADGVMRTMLRTKLMLAAAITISLNLVVIGVGLAGRSERPEGASAIPERQTDLRAGTTNGSFTSDSAPRPSAGGELVPFPHAIKVSNRLDRYGDPLPPLTVSRLGTIRWRNGSQPRIAAFSPDGKRIATGSYNMLHLFDSRSGEPIPLVSVPETSIESLAFTPAGETLVACQGDGAIRFWDTKTGELQRTLTLGTTGVVQAILSPDGKMLAAAVKAAVKPDQLPHTYLATFEAETGKEIRRLELDTLPQRFSPDGQFLATSPTQLNRRSYLIEPKSLRIVATLGNDLESVESMVFSPNSKTVVALTGIAKIGQWPTETRLTFYDLPEAKAQQSFKVPMHLNTATFLSLDGKSLLSGTVAIDIATGTTGRLPESLGTLLALAPGRMAGATWGTAINIWDSSTGKVLDQAAGHEAGVNLVVPLGGGQNVVTVGSDNLMLVWDVETSTVLSKLSIPPGARYVTTADRGTMAMVNKKNQAITVIDLEGTKKPRELSAINGRTRAIALSPDGGLLAAITMGSPYLSGKPFSAIEIVDTAKDAVVSTIKTERDEALVVAFSPDGKTLAIGSKRKLSLIDLATSQQTGPATFTLPGSNEPYESQFYMVTYGPDGQTLATADSHGGLRIWDAATGKQRHHLKEALGPMAFSPDGKLLASADKNQAVQLWEIATGKELRRLKGHFGTISALGFSRDGSRLYSGSEDSTVLVWDLVKALK